MRRVLGITRLSVDKDESTSLARQRELITAKALARGGQVIGWAEDADVSASKVHPMKRPALKTWLARPQDYDEAIFWRLDRFVRRMFPDFLDMITWSLTNGVGLVSATEELDLTGPMGRLLAVALATVAELESSNTSERVIGAHAYLRQQLRWGGGPAPYGYLTIPSPDGPGVVLRPDPESADLVREAVGRVIDGEAVNAVAADFNRRELPSPRDAARIRAGNPVRGDPWRVTSLRRILRNPALLGYVVHDEKPVPGDDDMPLMRAVPLISETDWDQLQHALDAGSVTHRRTQTPSLLLNIAFCGACGCPLYRWEKRNASGKSYNWYRCKGRVNAAERKRTCDVMAIKCDDLDKMAEHAFLAQVGRLEILARVYHAAVDNSDEIAAVHRALESVRAESDRGEYGYPGGADDYATRTARLSQRLSVLAALPVSAAGYEYKPTGETFSSRWNATDTPARRQLMLGAGFEIRATRTPESLTFSFQLEPELEARAVAAAAGDSVSLPGHDAIQASFEAANAPDARSLDITHVLSEAERPGTR